MPNPSQPGPTEEQHGTSREDQPLPAASEEEVLNETARMAREGRKELESDPREHKPSGDDESRG